MMQLDRYCELAWLSISVIGVGMVLISLSGAAGQHAIERALHRDPRLIDHAYSVDIERDLTRLVKHLIIIAIGVAGLLSPAARPFPRPIAVDIGLPLLSLTLVIQSGIDMRWRAHRYRWIASVETVMRTVLLQHESEQP